MPFTPLPYELAETIRSLKSQYCRHADTNNIPAWKRLFFPSVTARFCAPDGSILIENGTSYFFSNRDQLVNHFAVAFAQQQAIHVVGSGELEYVTKEDGSINEKQVKAVWSCVYHAASPGVEGGWSGTGGEYYYEIWRKERGEWVIGDLRFVRNYWRPNVH